MFRVLVNCGEVESVITVIRTSEFEYHELLNSRYMIIFLVKCNGPKVQKWKGDFLIFVGYLLGSESVKSLKLSRLLVACLNAVMSPPCLHIFIDL